MDGGHPQRRRAATHHTRAIALGLTSWVSLSQPGTLVDLGPIEWSLALFHAVGDTVWESGALTSLSIACTAMSPPDVERAEAIQRRALELVTVRGASHLRSRSSASGSAASPCFKGDPDGAIAIFDGVLADARRMGDAFVECVSLANSGWARLARGESRPDLFARHLELSLQLGYENGVGWALEGLAACAAAAGDVDRAGVLLGASETARLRTGLTGQRSFLTYRPFIDPIVASDRAADFDEARARGRRMPRRTALDLVLDPAGVLSP